jgi:hypothetical protein
MAALRMLFSVTMSLALFGCGASQPQWDAHDDSHCAALGYVFALYMEELGERDGLIRAQTIYQWYIEKLERPSGEAMTETERRNALLPLVRSIDGDIEDYAPTMLACGERASREVGFDDFQSQLKSLL